jgi:hypothetical protein
VKKEIEANKNNSNQNKEDDRREEDHGSARVCRFITDSLILSFAMLFLKKMFADSDIESDFYISIAMDFE